MSTRSKVPRRQTGGPCVLPSAKTRSEDVSTTDLLLDAPDAAQVSTAGVEIAARSPGQLFWRRFKRDKVALVSLGFIAVLIIVAIFAPVICKIVGVPGPNVQNSNALDQFGTPTGPSSSHPFGVDTLGRDVFARVLYGARVSLEVAIIATALSVTIGVVVGMTAGFFRGWVDTVLSRLIDILLAFPILLLALGI